MRRVAAVGPRDYIAAGARRAARPPMTPGAAIHQTGTNGQGGVDVPGAVAGDRPLALTARELPLEKLPATLDRPERIAFDDVDRAIRREGVTPSDAGLINQ